MTSTTHYLSAHARSAPVGMTVDMMDVVVRGDTKHEVIVDAVIDSRNR